MLDHCSWQGFFMLPFVVMVALVAGAPSGVYPDGLLHCTASDAIGA